MKCEGIIKGITVKVTQDINVVAEIKMEVNGDPRELKDLMKKRLSVMMESQQMTFGTGRPPEQKKERPHGRKSA